MAATPYSDEELGQARKVAYRVARSRGLAHADAEDIAQEALIRLNRQELAPDNPDAWITTTTQRLLADRYRAEKRRPPLHDGAEVEADHTRDAVIEFVSRAMPASAAGIQEPVIDQVWAQLDIILSDKEKRVLEMLADGHSHADIAATLGYKNADSVKATVAKIRRKTREITDAYALLRDPHPRPY